MARPPAPGAPPSLDDLLFAPELALLHTLRATLDVALVALTAAQPELWPALPRSDGQFHPEADAADDVIRCAQALARALDLYRALVSPPPFPR